VPQRSAPEVVRVDLGEHPHEFQEHVEPGEEEGVEWKGSGSSVSTMILLSRLLCCISRLGLNEDIPGTGISTAVETIND